ncbi:MAG: hypothetical protein COA79_20160 [Planctomycetota bacterium]|nr:MAG: hypothetical protein COA79_20160 [Planctomycetota bacterium]
MTKKEAKIIALRMIWGQATALCDTSSDMLSDTFDLDVSAEVYSEEEALLIQSEIEREAELIFKKLQRTKGTLTNQ